MIHGLCEPCRRLVETKPSPLSHAAEIEPDPRIRGFQRFATIPSQASAHRFAFEDQHHLYLGVAPTARRAAEASFCEFVERDCGLAFDPAAFPRAAGADHGLNNAACMSWNCFNSDQHADPEFPFLPLDDQRPVRWVPAVGFGGRASFVPADAVALRWTDECDRIQPPGSNGMCGHPDADSCRLFGLLELIERDATMRAWLTRRGWVRLIPDAHAVALIDPYVHCERDYAFFALPARADVFVIACISTSRNDKEPRLIASSACALGPEMALLRGLAEHAQAIWSFESTGIGAVRSARNRNTARVLRRSDHAVYWAALEQPQQSLTWLKAAPARPLKLDFARPLPQAGAALQKLATEVPDTLWVPLVINPYSQLGFHVFRALNPRLVPIYFGEPFRPLHAPGLHQEVNLNPDPHPFL